MALPAQTVPASNIPFPNPQNQAQAQADLNASGGVVTSTAQGIGNAVGTVVGPVVHTILGSGAAGPAGQAANTAGTGLSGIEAVGNFFNWLFTHTTMIGFILLGVIVFIVGAFIMMKGFEGEGVGASTPVPIPV